VTFHALQVCASRGAYEAIPTEPMRLDLAGVCTRMQAEGIDVVDARVMLIARLEREVTVGRDGRILIKTNDVAQAERLLAVIERFLELPPGAG